MPRERRKHDIDVLGISLCAIDCDSTVLQVAQVW